MASNDAPRDWVPRDPLTTLNVCLRQLKHPRAGRSWQLAQLARFPRHGPGQNAPGSRAAQPGTFWGQLRARTPGQVLPVTLQTLENTLSRSPHDCAICRALGRTHFFFWHGLCVRHKKPGCCRVNFNCAAGALVIASCAHPYHYARRGQAIKICI